MNKNYDPYYQVEAAGEWIALSKCLRCGATILMTKDGANAPEIHDKWHLANPAHPLEAE